MHNKLEWQYSKNTIYHLDKNYEIAITKFRLLDINDPDIKWLMELCEAYLNKEAWSIACFKSYDYYITIRCWDKQRLIELKKDYLELFKEIIND